MKSGAGTGAAVKSALAHGYHTTLLERDNTTYTFLTDYFRMPTPDSVLTIEPAYYAKKRTWRREVQEEDKFDVIIHNLFLGNVPPSESYTVEFWEDMRKLMRDNSVVAIVSSSRNRYAKFG